MLVRFFVDFGDEGRSNASGLRDTGVRPFKTWSGVGVRLPTVRTRTGVAAKCFSLVDRDDFPVLIGGLGGEGVGTTDLAVLFGESSIMKPASSLFAVDPGKSELLELPKLSGPSARPVSPDGSLKDMASSFASITSVIRPVSCGSDSASELDPDEST